MQFTLTINCDNASFEDDPHEVHRILLSVARRVLYQGLGTANTALFDANGNKVGQWTYGEAK